MTVKTSERTRQYFGERHRLGETYAAIAAACGVSKECVRYWCRRQRAGTSCQSQWQRRKAGILSQFDPLVRYAILRLRLEHPRWGPGMIAVHLRQRPALQGKPLPSLASIGRYLHHWQRFRRRRGGKSGQICIGGHRFSRYSALSATRYSLPTRGKLFMSRGITLRVSTRGDDLRV